jgi:hypothetical protein
MEATDVIKRIENMRRFWLFFVALFGIGGLVTCGFAWRQCILKYDWRMADLATSISGTTGVLWSAAGVILVYVVYLGQKIEIIQQRIELEENRKQLQSQAESMKRQNEIAVASQDYQIIKELVEDFCTYLASYPCQFSASELLNAVQQDIMKYIRETGSHEDKYLEYLSKFTEPEVKRSIVSHVKFSLAAISYKLDCGGLKDSEKSILITKLFQDFRKCYFSGLPMLVSTFEISHRNGHDPRFSHPDFRGLETLFELMLKFDEYQRTYVPQLFERNPQ